LSLCSFDDACFLSGHPGFVTAVVQPLEQLGQTAVDLVLRGLDEPQLRHTRIMLKPSIVERQSVAVL